MEQPDLEETAELVKPPQSRRGKGWSVVYKQSGKAYDCERPVYIKRQSGYSTRVWWRAFRLTPRLVCEHRALRFCKQIDVASPEVVSFTDTPEMTELILEDVGPAKELNDYLSECDALDKQDVISQAAALIARLHAHRWVHGALGDEHILVRDSGQVVLIDFEKAHWNPLRIKRDLDRLWRHTSGLNDEDRLLFMQHYRQFRQLKTT